MLALLATAGGLTYVFTKYGQLPRIALGSVLSTDAATAGGPRNVLIVGIDSAAGLDPDNPIRAQREDLSIGGMRSDTIMVLHIDPATDKAALLSLPRDLWLPIAGRRGNQRINVAVGQGGASLLIATIQQYFDIPIHNYLQVDFAGFQQLVKAIGGVPVYFDTPARDRKSGLSVPKAGCITLSPDQALAYARSRAFQYYDGGRWHTDPTGDLGRISRQQDFLRRALRHAVSRGLRNPVTLDRLIDAGLDSVVVDDSFTADDIVGLGDRFRGFNPDNLAMYALPVVEGTAGGASIVRMVERAAQPILELFRATGMSDARTDTTSASPSSVRVQVLNGSGRSGEARRALAALEAVGFAGVNAQEAERFDFATTVVRFAPGNEADAQLVARWLQADAVLTPVEGLIGGDVVVVTATDWAGVRRSPRSDTQPVVTTTSATSASTATGPTTTSTSTASASATSTTAIGAVPQEPPGVSC